MERGDFANGFYEASIRRNPDRMQVLLTRLGNVWGIPLTLSKAVTLSAGSETIEIGYKLEGLPADFCQHLAVEFNFAGLPAQAAGRCFRDGDGRDLGQLGSRLDLKEVSQLSLEDDWLDIRATLNCQVASNGGLAGVWTFPIESVSQSEAGFELVHQSVVVMPHWIVTPDASGCWQVVLTLTANSLAAAAASTDRSEAAARLRTGA
jgi:alpha-amylase